MRHELHLMRVGLIALAGASAALAVVGYVVWGPAAALSALLAAAIMGVNHALAALSTGWSRKLTPTVVAVGYGGFVVRMAGVFFAFGLATSFDWIHKTVFATSFCIALAVTLGTECVSFARRSYVPRWRLTA